MARKNRRAYQSGKIRRPYRGIKWGQRDPVEMLRLEVVERNKKARNAAPKEGDRRMSYGEDHRH